MLTFTNPQHTAEDAAEAMRNLVFATRSFADPSDTYWVVSDLAATARRMEQVAIQVASAHRENLHLAHDHTGSAAVGEVKALTAAAHLHRVADLLRQAHTSMDLAAKHSSAIAWYDTVPDGCDTMLGPVRQNRRPIRSKVDAAVRQARRGDGAE